MQRLKDDVDVLNAPQDADLASPEANEDDSNDSKSKKAIRKKKHSQLEKLLDRKRLRDEINFIDGW